MYIILTGSTVLVLGNVSNIGNISVVVPGPCAIAHYRTRARLEFTLKRARLSSIASLLQAIVTS